MHKKHTLVTDGDVRRWVENRAGQPALKPLRDDEGRIIPRLAVRFSGRDHVPVAGESEGLSPCSWTQWLAEFDRQQLALRVSPEQPVEIEFVLRRHH